MDKEEQRILDERMIKGMNEILDKFIAEKTNPYEVIGALRGRLEMAGHRTPQPGLS
jgi:hypothetical protein